MQFRQFIIQKIKSYYLVIAYKSPIYHVYGIPYTKANCMSVCCQTDDVLHMHINRQSFDMQANMPWFKIRTVDNLTNSFKGDTLTPTPPMPMCPDVVEWFVVRDIYTYITQSVCISSKIRMVPTGYCYDCNYVFYLRIQGQPNGQHYNVHMHW